MFCAVKYSFLKIISIFYTLLTLGNLFVNPSELAERGDLVRERIVSHEIITVLMIEQPEVFAAISSAAWRCCSAQNTLF